MATIPPPTEGSTADTIAKCLARYLGPHTGRVAVKTFAMKATGRGPETLTVADWPKLEPALRPMLRTLVGAMRAEMVLAEIKREIGL
jgi:hypothetical protein